MAVRRTLLISDNKLGRRLEDALLDAGCDVVATVAPDHDFHSMTLAAQPKMLVIAVAEPRESVFQQLNRINQDYPCAVVMFVENSQDKYTQQAVRLGVGAYIVDGFDEQRVKPILEIAETRFSAMRLLQSELDEARNALSDRKLIDRAKGLLMDTNHVTEAQAFKALRSMAMQQNVKLADVARGIVAMHSALSEVK